MIIATRNLNAKVRKEEEMEKLVKQKVRWRNEHKEKLIFFTENDQVVANIRFQEPKNACRHKKKKVKEMT